MSGSVLNNVHLRFTAKCKCDFLTTYTTVYYVNLCTSTVDSSNVFDVVNHEHKLFVAVSSSTSILFACGLFGPWPNCWPLAWPLLAWTWLLHFAAKWFHPWHLSHVFPLVQIRKDEQGCFPSDFGSYCWCKLVLFHLCNPCTSARTDLSTQVGWHSTLQSDISFFLRCQFICTWVSCITMHTHVDHAYDGKQCLN